jgi:hypothetical protein
MNRSAAERQQLLELVNALPEESLVELASFLDYLRYKSDQRRDADRQSSSFLVLIAGLGSSGLEDVSERDEEILRNEIDPVYGWSSRSNNSV